MFSLLLLVFFNAIYFVKSWNMPLVTSYQARVQGDKPIWNEEHQVYVSRYGNTFEEQYIAALDSVNAATIEGALMYIQSEAINVHEQSVKCSRKNNVQYIVFYKMSIVQGNASLAEYSGADDYSGTFEYCPVVPMDEGRCTFEEEDISKECQMYYGGEYDNFANIGSCVGASFRSTDPRAKYENNYWFSYPNSCVMKPWVEKTPECRKKYPGGLCPFGMKPDGINCTYAYEILGYISIDDLVGITSMNKQKVDKKDDDCYIGRRNNDKFYKDYHDFCIAGNIEFDRQMNDRNEYILNESISFWNDPFNQTANRLRTEFMVEYYQATVELQKSQVSNRNVIITIPEFMQSNYSMCKNTANEKYVVLHPNYDDMDWGHMKPLPFSLSLLKEINPPCYKTVAKCERGCYRDGYSQICKPCTPTLYSSYCVTKPFNEPSIPKLTRNLPLNTSEYFNATEAKKKGRVAPFSERNGASLDSLAVALLFICGFALYYII